MKKIKFLILVFLGILLTACVVEKEAIDEDDFIRIMTNEGFNIKQQFEYSGDLEEYYIATDPKGEYEIEFWELDSDSNSNAKEFYENAKRMIETQKKGTYKDSNVDLINTNKYTLTNETMYIVISRIEDTFIYLDVDKEYKEEVNNILKKLGY